MVRASFEHEGNYGLLSLKTHFGQHVEIPCSKLDDEKFRLGGTAIHEVVTYEGVILNLSPLTTSVPFRAFRSAQNHFEGLGVLSPEQWSDVDRHCWVTEYYSLDMEGNAPSWFISKAPIQDAHHLFVNLDVLDGGDNVIKRYRVSPFTGQYRLMDGING